ncbi:MAG: glycerophosphodiester phosphodiesterase family protein [Elusimicrobiota bacterium]|jgi:glycerophosphoryl diester phosphodiesterase
MRVIAHRGASGYFPENTLPAFQAALDLGAQAVEFDVQQTRDNVLVVVHDSDLRRLSKSPKRVGECSYEQLSGFDVGRWSSERFAGCRVPRLEQVLELLLRRNTEIHLEIKQPGAPMKPYEGIEARVLELLLRTKAPRAQSGILDRVIISSFHHPSLHRLRALDKSARLAYLAVRQPAEEAVCEAAQLSCESVNIHSGQASSEWVKLARAKGIKVLVYTVDDPAEAERLRGLGVDGIFSNLPDCLRGPAKLGGTQ